MLRWNSPRAHRQYVRNQENSLVACHIKFYLSRQPDSDSLLEPCMMTVTSRQKLPNFITWHLHNPPEPFLLCLYNTYYAARQRRRQGGNEYHNKMGVRHRFLCFSTIRCNIHLLLKLMPCSGGDNGFGGVE